MIHKYVWVLLILLLVSTPAAGRDITDAHGRKVTLPETVSHIICSGSGCLRLITYFQAQDRVVAVDDIEKRRKKFDARPYLLANPGYKQLPVFGQFRGHDDPEKILGLSPQPQVIFKTYSISGTDPDELSKKTGIPVVVLEYGDLGQGREKLFNALTLIGRVLKKEARARVLVDFFTSQINALEDRTKDVSSRKSCFVGGIAFKGPHGFSSTEPSYPPFSFVNARNIAASGRMGQKKLRHANLSRETILASDPDVLFMDLSTLLMGAGNSGLDELRNDPVYQSLSAVKTGQVYGVLPYNLYTQNLGSVLADAWYIGKVLYPERFNDIDPEKKADEIYTFLVSAPVFGQMDNMFRQMAFKPVRLVP